MMEATTWFGLDFGTAYIRVVRARAEAEPGAVVTEVVQFNGRPELRNITLLNSARTALEEVGDNVYRLDPAQLDVNRLHYGLSLDNDPDSEIGQAGRLLLDHIARILARDHGFVPGNPHGKVLIAIPGGGAADLGPRLEARLGEVGFAEVTVANSALAALAHYTAGQLEPGRYLVVDAGASWTRLALLESQPGQLPVVLKTGRGTPGGRDFDTALSTHFEPQLAHLGHSTLNLERRANIEAFKRGFSTAWANGKAQHEAVYTFDFTPVTLALDRDTFNSPKVAGEWVARFRQTADTFLTTHAPAAELQGLLLVGGGAHWPFVVEWAESHIDPARVMRDQYPEHAIVMGLPLLAAMQVGGEQTASSATSINPLPGGARSPAATPGRATQRPSPRTWSSTSAAILEFLGGLVGILGLGWFFGPRNVPASCLALFGWWITLAILFALGLLSTTSNRPELVIPLLVLWLGVPLLSALLLHRRGAR